MVSNFRKLYAYRDLLVAWTAREIRVRYKQSLLGIAWAILQPLLLMLMFAVIFSLFIKVPTGGVPYPVFVYVALLPWTFFANGLSFASSSLVNNMNLVTKIYFPREIFPLAAILASLVDLMVASAIFLLLLVIYRLPFSPVLVLVPVILAIQILLTIGLALVTSATQVFYRDVRFVIPLGLQLWLYATPVIYPVSLVPEWLRSMYMLNPMAGIIDAYRQVIIAGQFTDPQPLVSAAVIAVLLFTIAYRYFKQVEMEFADFI